MHIAYFISPHGYGHAARASAVMAAIHGRKPATRFQIFTKTPRWFFEESLTGSFDYHPVLTDIGLVQETSMDEDVPATVRQLDEFLPFGGPRTEKLADQITQLGCRLVICDIAPLGIAVAQEAGVPAVLVENFTWDWIYAGYLDQDARLEGHIAYLRDVFGQVGYHIQTEPVCQPQPVDLTTAPVSRRPRTPRRQIRQQLGIPEQAPVVLVTMGGIEWQFDNLDRLTEASDVYFVIPGGADQLHIRDNLVLLPHYHDLFHPDLVHAADAVIGKVGYSTLSEVYHAGVPFGYVPRPQFPESPPLVDYIEDAMPSLPLTADAFHSGRWLSRLPDLLALPRASRQRPNGADQAADFVLGL